MPPPNLFPCGGVGQKPCPPQPAVNAGYTLEEVHAYGDACYAKGEADALAAAALGANKPSGGE